MAVHAGISMQGGSLLHAAAPGGLAGAGPALLPRPVASTMPTGASRQQAAREWGRLPNVHWGHSLTMQQLRDDPRIAFEALPPVEQVVLAGPDSYRFVRQDDELWDQLHDGVLTTGLVRSALGLYERSAAKKLGIGSSRAGHGELLKAYHHLRQSAAGTAGTAGSSVAGVGAGATAAAMAAAAAHNAAAVVAYNAAKRARAAGEAGEAGGVQDVGQGPQVGAAAAASATGSAGGSAGGSSKHAKRRVRKKQAKAAAAGSAGHQAVETETGGGWGVSEEQKQKRARALGSLGLMSICCTWGKAQEAAALLQVAHAFPSSQLAEVGLCRLQLELLPVEWGFSAGSLPPIGASPDAVIRHHMVPPAAAPAAASAAGGLQRVQQEAPTAGSSSLEDSSGGSSKGIANSSSSSSGSGSGSVSSSGSWDIDGLLQRLQLAGQPPPAAAASSAAAALQPGSASVAIDSSTSSNGIAASSISGSSGSSGSVGYLVEVVEIKNTCPFGHSRRGGKLRTTEFAVADRGPRQAVPPEWVPQLQLHMLCTGTPSGLLVSRSATKGTRVFRMRRDDHLLRLMLLVISRLWQQHVLTGRPPPADVYASWREHHDMLRRIGEVARGAQLVATIPEEQRGQRWPEADNRWFLD